MNLPIEFCERMRELVGGEYDDFIKSRLMINKIYKVTEGTIEEMKI